MLYLDIPTQQEIKVLNRRRADACVSIYVPATPLTQEVGISRTELKNLARQAFSQLEEIGFDKRRLALMQERIDDLLDDDSFWRLQAHSLAVLLTPDDVRTFRLANKLLPSVEVSDRFHLKPLLRAVAFPHTAFVLALSENAVRLVEIAADREPQVIKVPSLPKDAASAVGKSTINDRSPSGRIHGLEGQKVRLTQYARIVDAALRPILTGLDVPLILAASDKLAPIYRSLCSYPSLLTDGITNTDDRSTNGELEAAARSVLDRRYASELADVKRLFEDRASESRTSNDLSDIARAATFGAIDTLLIDIDAAMPGTIDETSGLLALATADGPKLYDIVDEIAGRTINTGGRVIAVRSPDIPGGGPTAAILRYPV